MLRFAMTAAFIVGLSGTAMAGGVTVVPETINAPATRFSPVPAPKVSPKAHSRIGVAPAYPDWMLAGVTMYARVSCPTFPKFDMASFVAEFPFDKDKQEMDEFVTGWNAEEQSMDQNAMCIAGAIAYGHLEERYPNAFVMGNHL